MSEKKAVLVVDDSRVSRMMIKAIIADTRPNWEIQEAGSGDEALTLLEDILHIDLMILDYNMPGMDGLTLGKELKQKHPEAKIHLLTANIQESIRQKANKAGVAFVKKPITEEKIVDILSSVES